MTDPNKQLLNFFESMVTQETFDRVSCVMESEFKKAVDSDNVYTQLEAVRFLQAIFDWRTFKQDLLNGSERDLRKKAQDETWHQNLLISREERRQHAYRWYMGQIIASPSAFQKISDQSQAAMKYLEEEERIFGKIE